jgi:glycosyltransferase involved in cell wall biosynthesis/SAM-dependent methyltransferase
VTQLIDAKSGVTSVNVPRVSIVLPIYNGEKYLEETIEAVLHQTFSDWELLLVDDGSRDGSVDLAHGYVAAYPDKIRYLEHPGHTNHGQFATRALGAQHAQADLVALLDQDDVWDPYYLEAHLTWWDAVAGQGVHLSYGPSLYWHPVDATGSRDFIQPMPPGTPRVFAPGELLESYFAAGYANTPNPCCALLRREVFDHVGHLTNLAKGSPFEDQYLWWYIASRWPVAIHRNSWVHYRKHDDNAYDRFMALPDKAARAEVLFLKTVQDDLSEVCPDHTLLSTRKLAIRISSLWAQVSWKRQLLRKIGRVAGLLAAPVRPLGLLIPARLKRMGTRLARPIKRLTVRAWMGVGVEPLSYLWGGDRGPPIFAHYIDEFLQECADDIRGHCLVIYNEQYRPVAWEHRAERLDTFHVQNSNPQATIVGELTGRNNLASDCFDCVVCTHALQSIADVGKAVTELYRILKPGGVLLVAVPLFGMYDPRIMECWRFTDLGLEYLLTEEFGAGNVIMRSYGNSVTAAGQLRGLTADEYTHAELNIHDPRFAVEVCGRATKSGALRT